jgi:trimethylamine--corrinoid protein Co-methyltransferase
MIRGPAAGTVMTTGWGLKTLSPDALDKIHAATLDVLQTTGVRVDSQEALKILTREGCWVNTKTKVVRFPEHIVKQALDTCPSQILLAGRKSGRDFMMGGREVGFTTFGTGVQVEDLETGEIRDSTKADVARIARLTDALTHMDVLSSPVEARDKPGASHDLHMFEAVLMNCTKHYACEAENGDRMETMLEMAKVVAGGAENLKRRPIFSMSACPTSPLQLIEEAADVIVVSARNWIPINVLSMVMAGATSPISVSGALVTHNAEVIAGIVLAQAANPGAPVIYGSSSTTFDMRYGTAVVGVPEMAMMSAAAADLANFYGLPSYVAGG